MKYENCPTCDWNLGIPDKLAGHPVTCPKCNEVFLSSVKTSSNSKPGRGEKKKSKSRKPKSRPIPKPTPRALPLPAALVKNEDRPETDSSPPMAAEAKDAAPKLRAIEPRQKKERAERNSKPKSQAKHDSTKSSKSNSETHVERQSKAATPVNGTQTIPEPTLSQTPVIPPDTTTDPSKSTVTARIIKSVAVEEDLAKDGKLPSLQLRDDSKPEPVAAKLKTSPIFLGLLICVSVISSGLMLAFGDFGNSGNQQTLNDVRAELEKFYAVRPDVEPKPYQLELREAQLAHSRGDRAAEVAAYRKVIARFHAEDRNQYIGVTGLPSDDRKLKDLVSIMLGNGKNSGD